MRTTLLRPGVRLFATLFTGLTRSLRVVGYAPFTACLLLVCHEIHLYMTSDVLVI